jgi:predicted permease
VRNLRLAFRTLARTPFVTTIAVLSLALGIGANTAIFSVFEQFLLRKLPIREPGELVILGAPGPNPGSQSCGSEGGCDEIFSYPMYRDLEKGQSTVKLAGHVRFSSNISFRKRSGVGQGALITGSYFPVLGVQPALGRLLTTADDEIVGGHPVVVLGHRYWTNTLGADRTVLNDQIVINGTTMTIVGVGPPEFTGITLGTIPDLYVPMVMRRQVQSWFNGFENRRNYWLYAFGRLAPGATPEAAAAALNAVYTPILNDVEAPLQERMSDKQLVEFKAKKVTVTRSPQGQSSTDDEARTPLAILFGVTAIVLLIACANIANLLLARGAGRATEVAVRMSLGARRGQVIAQLLLEAVLLALMAGGASLLVSRWTLAGLTSLLPEEAALTIGIGLQWPMVLFAAGLSLATGLAFGLFPAVHSTRPDLIGAIRQTSGQSSGTRSANRFRTSLVTAQIALAMALLTCAGLFVQSLRNVSRVDVGANVERLVTFSIAPELNAYSGARSAQFFARLEEELRAIPGVTSVAAARVPFLAGSNWGTDVSVEGFKRGPEIDANSRLNTIGPGYLSTLGMPLISGREFTEADLVGRPGVVIVNQAFAKKFNLGPNPVGRRMSENGAPDAALDLEIVGFMQDTKYSEVKGATPPLFFKAYKQDTTVGDLNFYVRTAGDPAQLLRAIPGVVARLDPDLPIDELKTMEQQVRENVSLDRVISILSSAFAGLATLLAAIGLYGVLAYSVAQRTREIGVRMALGATAGSVRGMVLRNVAVLTGIGGVIGVGLAVALGRAASSILFGLKGHDPVVLTVSAVLLALVALGAGYLPALRASRVNPMQALRWE